jgi:hypothetical protein
MGGGVVSIVGLLIFFTLTGNNDLTTMIIERGTFSIGGFGAGYAFAEWRRRREN